MCHLDAEVGKKGEKKKKAKLLKDKLCKEYTVINK